MFNWRTFLVLSVVLSSCEADKGYNNEDVAANYQVNKKQLLKLKKYFNSVVPNNKFVEIEFDDDTHLFRFGIYSKDLISHELIRPGFLKWGLNTDSATVKAAIATIGWNQQTLKIIKQKLDSANCISVESGEPCKIGFQRRDLGKYSYLILAQPMSESLKTFYNNGCAYHIYDNKTVFM